MEDIDDLLDEVETKYVKRTAQRSTNVTPDYKTSSKLQILSSTKSKTSGSANAIDAAIDDILDLDLEDKFQEDTSKVNNTKSCSVKDVRSFEQARRCLPVYLGGSGEILGLGSAVNQRPCDQLRCTSCDFRVCNFDNMAWKADTDYLFLRNNVPDFDKLKPKLIKKKGWRAYCCQCSWRNVFDLAELTDSSLKWVCGKHIS